MEEQRKKVGQKMSLIMGVTLSFMLSLTGTLSSGHFTLPGFLLSFAVSTLLALVIGFLLPMHRVNAWLTKTFRLQPGDLKTRVIRTLVSDLIYTPVITFVMVLIAWRNAVTHGAKPAFGQMYFSSLLLSLAVAFVLVYFLKPVFIKIAAGNTGTDK